MRTSANYLEEVKFIQETVRQQQAQHTYITLKQIWKNLRESKLYFKSYQSFIRIMGEGNLSQRIGYEKDKIKNNEK